MQCYLFVHFKEKRTPDGEQVYFGVSKDGYHWEEVNHGQPVLWSMLGEKGVRDFTVLRSKEGKFYIIATDLSLAYSFRTKYNGSWENIKNNGSTQMMMWESDDLVYWSKEKELPLRKPGEGCCWAPDIIQDATTGEYILHWSSPNMEKKRKMCIYYTRTKDFKNFTEAKILYEKKNNDVIDSCMVEEKGVYYLWVKSSENPTGVIMLKSDAITGPFERMYEFDQEMEQLVGGAGAYEAPTVCRLEDGSYNLMLDFFGAQGKGQGYVSFHTEDISCGRFIRSEGDFSYPYGFKHGTILTITPEEYERVATFDFDAESYNR
ncbi:glycoside hydrolase family 43 protein [Anaerosporobacter faecicola]|uniref:glycoside hydrolase family 43 protein n=1 Tax=Anaerosporobacter faecicola TaxID=2718714 RepID=UPI0014392D05|nr:glycoside hydrolase family 43 protein [Anaerosporobacter faecicola]